MQAFLKDDNGQHLATVMGDSVFVMGGVDRQMVAFELFKTMMKLMSPQAQVTWGAAWRPTPEGQ